MQEPPLPCCIGQAAALGWERATDTNDSSTLKESAPAAQTGIVVGVERLLDVVLSGGERRAGVPSTSLKPFLRFQPDQHVLHASGFLGRIDDVRPALQPALAAPGQLFCLPVSSAASCVSAPCMQAGVCAYSLGDMLLALAPIMCSMHNAQVAWSKQLYGLSFVAVCC